jgi:hypothetical protein
VLDIDGNGWSDRYRLLAHANTPVLKQASNLTGFFEHLAAPGPVVHHYAHDLSDLPVRVRGLLQQQPPGELSRMAGEAVGAAGQRTMLQLLAGNMLLRRCSQQLLVPNQLYGLCLFCVCF